MEELARAALDAAPVMSVLVDGDLRIVTANPAWFAAATEFGDAPLAGDDLRKLRFCGAAAGSALERPVQEVLEAARRESTCEVEALDAQGRPRTFTVSIVRTPLARDRGPEIGAVLVLVEITDRRSLERALARRSDHDPITGLAGERLFVASVSQALSRASRSAQGLAILECTVEFPASDVDPDLAASIAAERLTYACRGHDILARLGPLEFAVALEGLADAAEVRTVRDRLQAHLGEPFEIVDQAPHAAAPAPVVRIGTAIHWPEHGPTNARNLLARAQAGRDHTGGPQVLRAQELSTALRRGELHLAYQPVLSKAAPTPLLVEVLLRWRHPEFGVLTPATFLAIGDIPEDVSEWVIEQAAAQAAQWRTLTVTVNVSAAELLSGTAVRAFRAARDRHGYDVPLAVEVRARDLDTDPAHLAPHLAELSAIGVGVILDAAGEGPAYPINLRQPSIAAVKVDRSITTRALVDRSAEQALLALVALGAILDVPVLAAGVESQAVRDAAEGAGVQGVQGFAVAAPMHAEEISALLA